MLQVRLIRDRIYTTINMIWDWILSIFMMSDLTTMNENQPLFFSPKKDIVIKAFYKALATRVFRNSSFLVFKWLSIQEPI